MQKSDIKFIIVFIAILVFSGIYLFQSSLAKYRRQITSTLTATVASWNIKVNNEMIVNKTELDTDITPVINTSTYVKAGTIAPGTTGYFDLVINAEDVDVDFSYEIEIETEGDTPLLDFVITAYSINGVTMPFDPTTDTSIIGDLTKNTTDTTLRISFAWNDGSSNLMNNQQDTQYAANPANKNTNVAVHIHFEQKR